MTVQTLKIGKERFVLLREKDYRALKAKVGKNGNITPRKTHRLSAQDRGDIAEAKRRLADPNDRSIPWEKAKKELGLG
jgi:hypothetical protein